MKKLFITLIVSVLFVTGVNSQSIAKYLFNTTQTAVLEDMTSKTTQLIGPATTDVASPVIDMGFTFNFMGTPYSQFSVNSNGQLALGSTVIPNTGINASIANTPLIVPISGGNAILSSGKVHYMVKGVAPNRILVVEWKDLNIPSPIIDNNPPMNEYNASTVEVLLYETTGLIEFKYGTVNNNSVPTITKATFISSSNTANTVKYVRSGMISAIDTSAVATYPLDAVNTNLLNQRYFSFTPQLPSTPVVTVVDSCNGTSSLTASNYQGTLLWSTMETTPKIVVSTGGLYTVTQQFEGFTSLVASGFAIPVPTITGPMVNGLPATLDSIVTDQGFKTDPGMTLYTWSVSSQGAILNGQGTDSITVRWTFPTGQQTVSVNYTNHLNCVAKNATVQIINYYPFPTNIDVATVKQFVDPMPHFAAGLRVDAKAGGKLFIKTVKVRQIGLSTGTPLANNDTIGKTITSGMGNYAAYAISKNDTTFGPAMWPAQTIEAKQGFPLSVQYENKLVGVRYKDFNILADQTLLMNGYALTGDPLTQPYRGDIPMVVHLHGGEVPSNSDGGPTQWFMPTGNPLQGPGFLKGATTLYSYPNKQEAATIWYHPHDQGLTRINVYTGLAGYYFLRGQAEEDAKLPGWSGDDKVQEVTPVGKVTTFNDGKTYLPEIELAVQDRMFNVKGELYWPVAPTNPEAHPFWTPEFFGDVMTVNGKTWPYLSVAPRKYRFRILDGCNARFLNMWLKNLDTNANGPKITVVGGDGGLLSAPVDLDPANAKTLFMAPGERFDVIIDFTGVAVNTVFTLMNDAAAPYPTGSPVSEGTTDRIMQFVVNGKIIAADGTSTPADKSVIMANLRTNNKMVQLTDFAGNLAPNVKPVIKRQILLNEVTGAGGPLQVLINNSHFDAAPADHIAGSPAEFGGPTEMPVEGTTELFQIINTTIDAHPMHIHAVQWQLVSRQTFDRTAYLAKYMSDFTAQQPLVPIWPAGLGYPGGAGSPFPYLTLNGDSAVGGNPAVGPFLTANALRPANPEEMGWKDDIKAFPGEVATFAVRFAPTDRAVGSAEKDLLLPFDPSIGPGYVWHCHIIDHEDMDMMRPLMVQPSALRFPQITAQPNALLTCIGSVETMTVTSTSDTQVTHQWQKSIDGGKTWADVADDASHLGAKTSALTISQIAMVNSTYQYRAILTNIDGVTTSNSALLTVDPDLPTTVSLSTPETVIYVGEQVLLTPTHVNGGTNPTYEWFINGVSKGTGSTYQYAPVTNDLIYVKMTSNAHCATPNPSLQSNTITMNVTPASTLTSDGDWNVPATWSTGVVPKSTDNVVIPLGKTVQISSADAVCNMLILEGTLTSTGGSHSLTIFGDLTLDGTLTTKTNTVILKGNVFAFGGTIDATLGTMVYGGAAAQTVSNLAPSVVNNLTIDNKVGVTLPVALTVSSLLTINPGAKLTNPALANVTLNNVLINSDNVSGTGTFVDNGFTTATLGGVANVQQYLMGGRNWYVSSPVTAATTSSLSTASVVTSYNEALALWVPENSALNVLKGYVASVTTAGNVTFNGSTLNTGVLVNSTLTRSTGVNKSGYNLVGNPYPSYLNWLLLNANSSNLETTIWCRTKNVGNTAYVFDTYNATSWLGTNNSGTPMSEQLAPMQAFWVRVATGFTGGTLSLNNAMRSHEGAISNRLKSPLLVNPNQQVLHLQVSNGINSDEAIVMFNSNASNAFDAYDSEKMTNANAAVPEIYTLAGTEPVAINGLNSVSTNPELSLGFTAGQPDSYTIKATDISNFDLDTHIILRDKLLNADTELNAGSNYTFASNVTDGSTRFSLIFKSTSVVTGNGLNVGSGSESIYIFKNQSNQINVHRNDAIGEGTVTVFSSTGQRIVKVPTTGVLTLINEKLLPGVYMVTVDVQGKSTNKKITLN